MNGKTHPVEQEEVMAYLDGQLDAARAATVAAHLDECAECQALAGDLRGVSQQAQAWQVEPAPARLNHKVHAALTGAPKARSPLLRPSAWQLGAVAALLLVVVAISIPNLQRSRQSTGRVNHALFETDQEGPEATKLGRADKPAGDLRALPGPMIIRTAALTIATKEFDNARLAMEQILRQHGGHIAQLSTSGRPASGQTLTATLRVPVAKLDAALAELKKLGRVESESQGGEEVTDRYVDLMARLSNARNTEKRLVDVLQNRTGKVKDILEVEREIARVREEIEQMQAEQKNLENRVAFATLSVQLREEYEAQVNPPQASAWLLIRNAGVEGYRSVVDNALNLVLFLLSWGPPMLFWLALLFWPARLAWRRLRPVAMGSH